MVQSKANVTVAKSRQAKAALRSQDDARRVRQDGGAGDRTVGHQPPSSLVLRAYRAPGGVERWGAK